MPHHVVSSRRKRMARFALHAGTALAAALPAATHAQTAPVSTDEIVVTAQRRAERLENVPMSVTAVSGDMIARAGIDTLRDIGRIASGVQVNLSGAFTQPAIRGVTTLINGNGTENNVAIYIDGFYESNTVLIGMDLANLASIEVLKGPQGTLYGRNATGGAILVNTLAPSDTWTGKLNVSYARFDDRRASAYLSGPIAPGLRFGVAGSMRKRDGYLKLVDPNQAGAFVGKSNPLEQASIRTKLEMDLGENLTATAAYNYVYSNDTTGHVYTPIAHVPSFLPGPPRRATRLGEVSHDVDPILENKTNQATLKLEWKADFGTITSYTGYTGRKDYSLFDFDGTYAQVTTLSTRFDQTTFQQNLDVNVTSIDRLNLIVGANYINDFTKTAPGTGSINYGAGMAISAVARASTRAKAYSFYADATYDITDALVLNVGGRYSHDLKTIFYTSRNGNGTVTFAPTYKDVTFSKFTPRASLRYELAPRTNVYASWSKGFRSGAYNLGGAASPALLLATRPETITAYEVGFKTARPGLRFDIAGFYYDYRDLQVSVALPNANCPVGQTCVPVPAFANAPKAEIYGIDGQLNLTPVDKLNLTLSGAWLHARYKDFPNATGLALNPTTNTNFNESQNWAGQQMARSPNFSGSASIDYSLAVAGGELMLGANASYTDSFVISNPSLFGSLAGSLANTQRFRQRAYTLLGANITWTDPSGQFTLGVFGTNLTNKLYRTTYNGSTLGDYSGIGMPRQIGGRVGYKF